MSILEAVIGARAGQTIADLIETHGAHRGSAQAEADYADVQRAALAKNAAKQQDRNTSTEPDYEDEARLANARARLQHQKSLAAQAVRPGFQNIHRALVSRELELLEECAEVGAEIVRTERAAASCGVRLGTMAPSYLPDDVMVSEYRARLKTIS